jgi:hypothetical protein
MVLFKPKVSIYSARKMVNQAPFKALQIAKSIQDFTAEGDLE